MNAQFEDNGWSAKPVLKPWQVAAAIKEAIQRSDQLKRMTFEEGATHLWVRVVGKTVVVNAFRIKDDGTPRYPVDAAIKDTGFWFSQSLGALFQTMPIPGNLPRTMLTTVLFDVFQ